MKLQYGGQNVAHLIERPVNSVLERAKSELWETLKEVMPPDGVVEEATNLLVKEVREFEVKYPDLKRAKGRSHQHVKSILRLMALRYPALRKRRKCDDVTGAMPQSMQIEGSADPVLSAGEVSRDG
jgi:hypothetical protein